MLYNISLALSLTVELWQNSQKSSIRTVYK